MKKEKTADTRISRKTLVKVLKIVKKHRSLLIFSLLLAAVSVVMQLYIPILFGNTIDRISGKGKVDFPYVSSTLVQILALIILASASTWCMNLVNNRLAYRTVREMRSRAIRQIQILPLSYLDSHSTGDIVQRVIADTDQVSDGLLLGFTQLFSGVVTIFVTLGFMLSKNVMITVAVILMTPVSFLVANFISSHTFRMFSLQTQIRGKQTSLINEMIGSEKLVRAFGYEERASERFRKINDELEGYSRSAVFFSSLTNPSTRAVNNVIYAIVALIGAFKIGAGALTVGGLTVLLSYANQYMKPFNEISSVITELQNAMACAGRVFELTEMKPEPLEMTAEIERARGNVEIRNISFSYQPQRPLIEDFSFSTEPGTMVAIVGPTGCGKTTLINLLMRFYDVQKGGILVDGVDIRNVTRHSIRKQYGMVLQETWLKHGTVRENIAFGAPAATDEEIIKAATASHSWEFIRRMPNGLDTVIQENSLSQGQKQLLCITRVMLCRPPMLILDEATSSIDTRTETQIQQAFQLLMKGRTSFIVAHRLSTIRNADWILVMRDGSVIEQGTHSSLMKENGFYSELYQSQFASLEEEASL